MAAGGGGGALGSGGGGGAASGNGMCSLAQHLNVANVLGQTPLMVAAQRGHTACVRFLMDAVRAGVWVKRVLGGAGGCVCRSWWRRSGVRALPHGRGE